jgi:hypothetical protein
MVIQVGTRNVGKLHEVIQAIYQLPFSSLHDDGDGGDRSRNFPVRTIISAANRRRHFKIVMIL